MQDDGLTEEAGEGYFASISDLMVGVLFVFLLMLTVFALNFRDDSARQQVAEHEAERLRRQNEVLRQRLDEAADALQRELRNREQMRAGLLQKLATQLQAGGIQFELDQQSGVLHLSDAVPFATGRSDLSDPTARHTVDVLAQILSAVLPCFATRAAGVPLATACSPGDGPILETVLVEGHTDTQPFPNMTPLQSQYENDRLSTARALTVFATLRQIQPSLDSLLNPAQQPLLGVSGYGQRRPLPGTSNLAGADFTRNRRIDLRFVLSALGSAELQHVIDEIARVRREQAP